MSMSGAIYTNPQPPRGIEFGQQDGRRIAIFRTRRFRPGRSGDKLSRPEFRRFQRFQHLLWRILGIRVPIAILPARQPPPQAYN